METISEWLDKADEHLQYLEWTDEYRFAMGYCLQSGETGQLYTSYDDLFAAELDEPDCWFEPPDEKTLRTLLSDLSIPMFYHQVITIAGDGLWEVRCDEQWGSPPSSYSDGYEFMQCLALYLREKITRKPEYGHPCFFPGAARPLKSHDSPREALPAFITRRLECAKAHPARSNPTQHPSQRLPDSSDQNRHLDR